MKKVELSLLFRPIPYVNLRAYDALLQPLAYNISGSLIGLTKLSIKLKYY
jgi:hypothetical protein